MKYLFKTYKHADDAVDLNNLEIKVFIPKSPFSMFVPNEVVSFKLFVSRLLLFIMTNAKIMIYYLMDDDVLVHTSCVIPKCYKFPFLGKDDFEIGPCYTNPQYRGKGIYPSVLRYITRSIGNENTSFYMIVNENNLASLRGVEKADFQKCGSIRISKYTKKYLVEKYFD